MINYFRDLWKGLKLIPEVLNLGLEKKAKDLKAYTNRDWVDGYVQGFKDCEGNKK